MSPTLEEVMGSYDWKEVMKYATGFDFAAIERVLFTMDGDNDGPDWLLLCSLKTGGYGFVAAGCDYTGWGCQEGGEGGVVETLDAAKERLLKLVPDYYPERRAEVAKALSGIQDEDEVDAIQVHDDAGKDYIVAGDPTLGMLYASADDLFDSNEQTFTERANAPYRAQGIEGGQR